MNPKERISFFLGVIRLMEQSLLWPSKQKRVLGSRINVTYTWEIN
jgi:hypothetical protein